MVYNDAHAKATNMTTSFTEWARKENLHF